MKFTNEIEMANFEAWQGGIDTLKTIVEHGKTEELEFLLNELFLEEVPTETQINDILWFESEWLFENLGIEE